MAILNGMYLMVEDEEPDYDIDVTEQPVEDNVNLVDHVQRKPVRMPISGLIVGEDAAQIRENLKSLQNNASIVEYDGRNYFVGLIKGLRTRHTNKVANGFEFSFTLVEVRIAEASYAESLPAPIRAQAAPVISSGRKQTKSKTAKKTEEVQKVKFKAGSPWAEG
ncbi:phage baseplate protein [Paenibacillus caseinilyticus]|uniref:phage baseplate protein n=1 Tax=Paenibacillus caseinilyticus TaxID=3098138 RepID=UPI0022B88D6C|nr:hypothetical protein [Paenibacillus caseinilyticus]MCZ8518888.1 hypothetical protein [Paenibacillus caseinilyticus]